MFLNWAYFLVLRVCERTQLDYIVTIMKTNKNLSKIPVFILAGGFGTRISEETQYKPKPMIEIGGIPILIHLMRTYYAAGFTDFVICAGYQAFEIKRFFMNYESLMNHIEIDHRESLQTPFKSLGESCVQERWRVRIIDTGLNAMTGCRVARAFDLVNQVEPFENFVLTYGDGLSDVDLHKELDFHLDHQKIGTVLGVKNQARFGELDIENDDKVVGFLEKPESRQGYVNGGFFIFRSEFRKYLADQESLVLEREPLESLAQNGELKVFVHNGFWKPMDTLRDKHQLQEMWEAQTAPWMKNWKKY